MAGVKRKMRRANGERLGVEHVGQGDADATTANAGAQHHPQRLILERCGRLGGGGPIGTGGPSAGPAVARERLESERLARQRTDHCQSELAHRPPPVAVVGRVA